MNNQMPNQIPNQGSNGNSGARFGSAKAVPVKDLIYQGVTSWGVMRNPLHFILIFLGAFGAPLSVLYFSAFCLNVFFPGNGLSKWATSMPSKVVIGGSETVRQTTQGTIEAIGTFSSEKQTPTQVVVPQNRQVAPDSNFSPIPEVAE